MRHYVIGYPELSEADFVKIQNCRKEYDHLYDFIDPHVTFVFGTDISSEDFVTEIKKQSPGLTPVRFSLRCAVVNKDAFTDTYFTFLVPDEGFSQIVKLHDKFYSDRLFEFLRLDIDYIPHLEIGRSTDKMVCKKLADEWNSTNFVISGQISLLKVVTFENKILNTLMDIPLK